MEGIKLTAVPIEEVVEPLHKVMVIDDAFDEEIPASDITLDQLETFFSEFNQNGELEELFEGHGVIVPDLYNISDRSIEFVDFINRLWQLRNEQEKARQYLDVLFHAKLDKLDDLNAICENLHAHGFDVIRKNSITDNFNEVKSDHFKIVLLDYNLGPDGEEAIANARKKAIDIYNMCPEGRKPLMVLMSSYADVKNQVEKFRKDTDLGNVIFRFAPKENLKNKSTASLLVNIYKSETEQVHKLHNYVTTLEKAASSAVEKFKKDLSKITIDDYTFIHQTTVDEQSHPLGDYLGWLYGAHWSNLLLSNTDLKTQKDELDTLIVGKPLPYYGLPSDVVVEIYMNALFEPETGEIPQTHVLAGKKVEDGKDEIAADLPHLHLGDIFMKDGENCLFMVLNPQCDLERPVAKMGDQSILMIPGELHSLDDGRSNKGQRTELMIVEGKRNQVIWKVKNVISIPLSKFNRWRRRNKLKRKWRLRLPFALEIQHEFTSAMSRVGLPVTPPFAKELSIEVYIQNLENKMVKLLDVSDSYGFSASWPSRKQDKKIRLTLDFAMDLKTTITEKREEIASVQQPEIGQEGNPTPDKNAERILKKIDKFLDEFDQWFLTTPFFDFPTADGKSFLMPDLMKPVLDYREGEKDWKTLLLVNVITTKVSEVIEEQKDIEVTIVSIEQDDVNKKEEQPSKQ